ncbi:tetracycline resistance protein, class B [Desulfosporosinus acididurans]|uniref:Tetracycline resistance protein, class B n=1 Tax=Desulfosporosinus acididurans TaxID=476652 RepID=A0A0J1FLD7_9FIRM|nr:MFS transporter [Desulfosporosinus acididurans]KLU64177.1 tetracycline resistance protein, class B [Desulfosporosinus acididurans]
MKDKQTKPLAILFVIQFLVMVGFGIVIPVLPFFVSKLGGTPITLGVFMAAYSIMQFFFAPFWGRLSDRIGRRPVLLIGLCGYGFTYFLFGFASNLWVLIFIRALSGMISSATLPTAMAYLTDITEEGPERSKGLGLLGAAMGLGMIFGPAIGGWLGQYVFTAPFFVAGGLSLLVVPFAWFFLEETLGSPRPMAQRARSKMTLEVIKDPLFVLFCFNFVITFAMSMFEATFAWLVAAKVGFGPKEIGIVFGVAGVCGVIIQGGLMGRLVKKFGESTLVVSGAFLCALGLMLIMSSATGLTIILATVVYMAGTSLAGPTSSSLVTKYATEGQGVSLGLFQSFGSLGRMLGPIVGGALYGLWIGLPYVGGAGILVLIIIMYGKRILGYSVKHSI